MSQSLGKRICHPFAGNFVEGVILLFAVVDGTPDADKLPNYAADLLDRKPGIPSELPNNHAAISIVSRATASVFEQEAAAGNTTGRRSHSSVRSHLTVKQLYDLYGR